MTDNYRMKLFFEFLAMRLMVEAKSAYANVDGRKDYWPYLIAGRTLEAFSRSIQHSTFAFHDPESSNGRTPEFDSGNVGSSPASGASARRHWKKRRGTRGGALGMKVEDRVVYEITGRYGVAKNFFRDGNAIVHFDGDSSPTMVKWNHLRPE